MFEVVRQRCGEDIQLLHDIHELVDPIDATNMIKQLEQDHAGQYAKRMEL